MNIKINNTFDITPELLLEKFKDELAAAGIDKVKNISLCQKINAGEITASGMDYGGDYPGLDLELHLPPEASTPPILLVRLEQPKDEGVKTYLFGRHDSYAAYMEVDTRSDDEFDAAPKGDSIVVSGDTDNLLEVYTENQHVKFCGGIEQQRAVSARPMKGEQ